MQVNLSGATVSRVQKTQKPPNYGIELTKAAKDKGILKWKDLPKLDDASYEGVKYQPGDNVYICTMEPGGSPKSDPAQIMEIRQTGDERGRIDICVAWLYSKEDFGKKKGPNWANMWKKGASHVVSNSYQILPWDTLNGKAERGDVRTDSKVRVDVWDVKRDLRLHNDAAVRWVDEESGL
jgi:hypothetical protein